jgi:hypothetical protein
LNLTRDLIALRAGSRDLRDGDYELLDGPPRTWTYRRGAGTVVALNMSDAPADVPCARGTVRLGTRRDREGERVDGALMLRLWEGVVVDLG